MQKIKIERERERFTKQEDEMCIEDGGHLMGIALNASTICTTIHAHAYTYMLCRERERGRRGEACINGGDRDSCSMRESTDLLQKMQ